MIILLSEMFLLLMWAPLTSFSAKVKLISERYRSKETDGFRINVMNGGTVVLIMIIAHNQNESLCP